jgi:hypothetical protein
VAQLDNVFIRGSKIRFFILPDMLKNAPMFKTIGSKRGFKPTEGGGSYRGRGGAFRREFVLRVVWYRWYHIQIIQLCRWRWGWLRWSWWTPARRRTTIPGRPLSTLDLFRCIFTELDTKHCYRDSVCIAKLR